MVRFILSLLAAFLFVASPAFAGAGTDADIPTVGGKGIIAGTGVADGAGIPFVGIPVFFEADDSAAYTGPTGAVVDTGAEVCAVFGLTCDLVYSFDAAGAAGDEFTAVADCATKVADNVFGFAICH